MMEEICAGVFIIGCVLLLLYFLFFKKPAKFSKTVGQRNTTVEVTANQDLDKVSLIASFGGEKIKFERKRVRKGMTVDFVYPSSKDPVRLMIDLGKGKEQAFEL